MKKFLSDEDVVLAPVSFGHALPDGMAARTLQRGRFPPAAVMSAVSGLPFFGAGRMAKDIDLMHATDHLIPNFGRVPVVATIMDAIPLSHPEWVSMRLRSVKSALWRRSAHWASHVITISEYSKQEIEQHFGIPASKISVIPLGVDERWFQPIATTTMSETLRRYGLPDHFFLFVGTLQPRKNIARVIEAYRSLPQGIKNDVPLVIIGRAGWQCDDVVDALTLGQYGPSVFWLKHVPDDDLLVVVKAAAALVFPSLYEGFGLPVLEAFAAGTPVITSNGTSLPEVAGNAALLVDPLDSENIAEAMQRLLDNPELANTLRAAGYVRARVHSWERTASMTKNVYQEVLGRAVV
jgi:alpha-1,3-rhamnosyl/mannosyltransferase